MVDTIFADVAQPDQARIVAINAQYFLKVGGHFVISIKVRTNKTRLPQNLNNTPCLRCNFFLSNLPCSQIRIVFKISIFVRPIVLILLLKPKLYLLVR